MLALAVCSRLVFALAVCSWLVFTLVVCRVLVTGARACCVLELGVRASSVIVLSYNKNNNVYFILINYVHVLDHVLCVITICVVGSGYEMYCILVKN